LIILAASSDATNHLAAHQVENGKDAHARYCTLAV
jgi:hypothetical protein